MKVQLKRSAKGFTLIELMIVVAIIGILAAVAFPKFADLITKSKESSTKGSLGSLRSAVAIYYSDTEGVYPTSLSVLTTSSKYLDAIPYSEVPKVTVYGTTGHGRTNAETTGTGDSGLWYYSNTLGSIIVNCQHVDTKNSFWSTW